MENYSLESHHFLDYWACFLSFWVNFTWQAQLACEANNNGLSPAHPQRWNCSAELVINHEVYFYIIDIQSTLVNFMLMHFTVAKSLFFFLFRWRGPWKFRLAERRSGLNIFGQSNRAAKRGLPRKSLIPRPWLFIYHGLVWVSERLCKWPICPKSSLACG